MQSIALEGGFTDPVIQSATAFRAVMSAMARPGKIHDVTGCTPPAPMSVAAGAVILTLCDKETPISIASSHDCPEVRDWITFHTGAPIVAAHQAMFALGTWETLPRQDMPIGTPEYPDRSTTLIVDAATLESSGATLRGPGIKENAHLSLPEIEAFQDNSVHYPLGLDFIFTGKSCLAALPRTTKVS